MKITAPTTSQPTHPLYIDLLRLVENMRGQSRDKIVPTITQLYTPNNFWQQTYRWSQVQLLLEFPRRKKPKSYIALTKIFDLRFRVTIAFLEPFRLFVIEHN